MIEADKIKKAFLDGIISSRANGGFMSEANHRAFYEIGLNSGSAQHEINSYFQAEAEFFMKNQHLPNYSDTMTFLNQMAYKHAGCTVFVNPIEAVPQSINTPIATKAIEKEITNVTRTRSSKTNRRSKNHKNSTRRSLRGKSGNPKTDKLYRRRHEELLRQIKPIAAKS